MLNRVNTDRGFNESSRRRVTGVEVSIMCVVYSRGKVNGAYSELILNITGK